MLRQLQPQAQLPVGQILPATWLDDPLLGVSLRCPLGLQRRPLGADFLLYGQVLEAQRLKQRLGGAPLPIQVADRVGRHVAEPAVGQLDPGERHCHEGASTCFGACPAKEIALC
jgi:hypothetical protein